MATIKYQIGNTVYSCLNVGDVTGRYIVIQEPLGGGAGWGSPIIIPLFSGGSGSVVEHGGYKYTLGHLCVNGLRPAISRVKSAIAKLNIRYCINSTNTYATKQRNYGFQVNVLEGETPSSVKAKLYESTSSSRYSKYSFSADGQEHWTKWINQTGSAPFSLEFAFSGSTVTVDFNSSSKPYGAFTQNDLDCVQHMHNSYHITLEFTENSATVLSLTQT